MSLLFPWREDGWDHLHPAPPHTAAAHRLRERLAQDPAYRKIWCRRSKWSALEEAGLFDDGFDPKWVKALRAGEHGDPYAPWPLLDRSTRHDLLLVAPGGFAPAHPGHEAMIESAIARAQALGYRVLGVIVAPAHDRYARSKLHALDWTWPSRKTSVEKMAQAIETRTSVPVMVHEWTATLMPGELNFTDILAHISASWRRSHPGHDVRVGLIAGSDNIGFAQTACRQHPVFMVNRPGFGMPSLPRGAWACSGNESWASREIRLQSKTNEVNTESKPDSVMVVRDDGDYALSFWRAWVPHEKLSSAYQSWRARVLEILQEAWAPYPVELVHPSEQQAWLKQFASDHPVINLDPLTQDPSVYPWPVSRRFRAGDHQRQALWVGPRPGFRAFSSISPGSYWLVDDDISTGTTMKAVRQHLPKGVTICGEISLLEQVRPNLHVQDVVDLRDFLPGAPDGGLVVELPSGIECRMPYYTRWVSLANRASVPHARVPEVRRALTEAARTFLKDMGAPIGRGAKDHLNSGWIDHQEGRALRRVSELGVVLEA